MIFVTAALLVCLLVLKLFSPSRFIVHAATARELPDGVKAEGRWLHGLVQTPDGKYIDPGRHFVGHALRDSMSKYGIPPNSTFIGDYLDDSSRALLRNGDVVVVDGEKDGSSTGLRLRRFAAIDGDTVTFLPDGKGKNRSSRPLKDIRIKVTHVLTDPTPKDSMGIFANFLRKSVLAVPRVKRET